MQFYQPGAAIHISGSKVAAELAKRGHIGEIAVSGFTKAEVDRELGQLRTFLGGTDYRGLGGEVWVNSMSVAHKFEEKVDYIFDNFGDVVDGLVMAAGINEKVMTKYKDKILFKTGVANKKFVEIFKAWPIKRFVVEGCGCGGHILRKKSQFKPVEELVAEWRKYDTEKELFAVGDVNTENYRTIVEQGISGIGNGLPFYVCQESLAHFDWIKEILRAAKAYHDTGKEQAIIVESCVDMFLGRVLPNRFILDNFSPDKEGIYRSNNPEGTYKDKACPTCMEGSKCTKKYCIFVSLRETGQFGRIDNGILFISESYKNLWPLFQRKYSNNVQLEDIKTRDDLLTAAETLEFKLADYDMKKVA